MPARRRKRTSRCKREKEEIKPLVPPFPLSSPPASFSEAFSSVAKILEGRKKVLVLAGAGISVSCGIPDFRTKDKGLYSTLDFQVCSPRLQYVPAISSTYHLLQELGLSCPEELFDMEVFQEDPRPFFKFAKALYFPLGTRRRVEPSDSHRFLALLEKRGMLLRVYTQNIDGLEEKAGVSPKRMVYAHGSLQRATCSRCKRKVDASEIEPSVLCGAVPRCQVERIRKRAPLTAKPTPPRKLRRLVSDSSSDSSCGGVLKPDVTFFGESLQDKVRRCLEADREKADALIVIGTLLGLMFRLAQKRTHE